MLFAKKQKTKILYPKEWSRKHIFHPHFFIFLRNPKSMLKFLQNSLGNGMVHEIIGKEVSLSVKMHFSVSLGDFYVRQREWKIGETQEKLWKYEQTTSVSFRVFGPTFQEHFHNLWKQLKPFF